MSISNKIKLVLYSCLLLSCAKAEETQTVMFVIPLFDITSVTVDVSPNDDQWLIGKFITQEKLNQLRASQYDIELVIRRKDNAL